MKKTEISIVVLSCDKNSFLWDGFFTLLDKYWTLHPQRIVLSTESLQYTYKNVVISNSRSTNEDWSTRLFHAICDANSEYVIIMLDDFFIKDMVAESKIEKYFDIIRKDSRIAAISLEPQPGCKTGRYASEEIVKRRRIASYRINAQPTIWRSNYLIKILRKGESPWQFEVSGTFRSFFEKGELYAVATGDSSIIPTDKGWLVVRGVLNDTLADYYKKEEGIDLQPYMGKSIQTTPKNRFKLLRIIGYGAECIRSLAYKRFSLK